MSELEPRRVCKLVNTTVSWSQASDACPLSRRSTNFCESQSHTNYNVVEPVARRASATLSMNVQRGMAVVTVLVP
jgi:hypothetical protein